MDFSLSNIVFGVGRISRPRVLHSIGRLTSVKKL